MKNRRFAVLVNLSARQGMAARLWNRAGPEILKLLPSDTIEFTYSPPFGMEIIVNELAKEQGVNCFISAGGDGSINYLLNALLSKQMQNNGSFALGGIGLGSSNDFLKPYGKMVQSIPVRIDHESLSVADAVKVTYTDPTDEVRSWYFIANASLGLTAEANYFFNHPDRFLQILKKYQTGAAIAWAALRTLFYYKNREVILSIDEKEIPIRLSNLAVLKNPNVSGDFKYDINIQPDDGLLGLCYCDGMTRMEMLGALYDLSKGRFIGKEKRHAQLVKKIAIKSHSTEPLETDGEVLMARNISFEVVPAAINLLGAGYASNT